MTNLEHFGSTLSNIVKRLFPKTTECFNYSKPGTFKVCLFIHTAICDTFSTSINKNGKMFIQTKGQKAFIIAIPQCTQVYCDVFNNYPQLTVKRLHIKKPYGRYCGGQYFRQSQCSISREMEQKHTWKSHEQNIWCCWFCSSAFMLLSSYNWVSAASGGMKFGILVGGLKTTYHALRALHGPQDLEVKRVSNVLVFFFSAADQSTAAGHDRPTPRTLLNTLSP